MGRTIITQNDVRKAREARGDYPLLLSAPGTPIILPPSGEEPEEEQGGEEPEEEQGREEPEKEDLERQRRQLEELEIRHRKLAEVLRELSQTARRQPRMVGEVLSMALSLSQTALPAPRTADNYTDRLLKYIPAESVALYLTLQGIVLSRPEAPALNAWLWFAFAIGIIGTPHCTCGASSR
jgi:hypothetical protein